MTYDHALVHTACRSLFARVNTPDTRVHTTYARPQKELNLLHGRNDAQQALEERATLSHGRAL